MLSPSIALPHLLIVGPPGSGKGTQCRLLVDHFKSFSHIGAGDMLRQERSKGTLLGQYIQEVWSVKGLEDIAVEMITQSVINAVAQGNGFVIDDNPRSAESAKKWYKALQNKNIYLDCVIEFQFSADAAVKRLEGRRIDPTTGDVFHVDFKPPGNGEEKGITRREDDSAEAIKGRYEAYENNTEGRRFFKEDAESGLPTYIQIDVEGKSIEEVSQEILHHLSTLPPRESKDLPMKENLQQHEKETRKDGDLVPAMETAKVRQQVKLLSGSKLQPTRFPGTHPIGLGQENVDKLNEREYLFARKIDGERRLFLLMEETCYLVDRKMAAVVYPSIRYPKDWDLTLLDGELVTPEEGIDLHFVVFDALAIGGDIVTRDHLPNRMAAVIPLLEAIECETGISKMPFAFKLQRYFKLHALKEVVEEDRKKKQQEKEEKEEEEEKATKMEEGEGREVNNIYGVDGLIFMPVTMPYRLGWCKEVTKWKEMETIDFRLFKEKDSTTRWGLYVRASSEDIYFDSMELSEEDIEKHQLAEGDVAECQWEKEGEGRWKVVRKRTDKSTPNADWVVEGIVQNLKNPIEAEELIRLAERASSRQSRGNYYEAKRGGYGGGNRNRGGDREGGSWDRSGGRDRDNRDGWGGRGGDRDRYREGDRGERTYGRDRPREERSYGSDRPREERSYGSDRSRDNREDRSYGRDRPREERSYGGDRSSRSTGDRDRYREGGDRDRDNRDRNEQSWRKEPAQQQSPSRASGTPISKAPAVNPWTARQQQSPQPQQPQQQPQRATTTQAEPLPQKRGAEGENKYSPREEKSREAEAAPSPSQKGESANGWSTVAAKKPRKNESSQSNERAFGGQQRNNSRGPTSGGGGGNRDNKKDERSGGARGGGGNSRRW